MRTLFFGPNATAGESEKRFVSPLWNHDIIGTPAMIMAFGIFLLYPGAFLFRNLFGKETGQLVGAMLSALLGFWGIFVAFCFLKQLVTDRKVIWDYTMDHMRIGTWVAGTGVLASVTSQFAVHIGRFLFVMACVLWMLYIYWLVRMTLRGEFRRDNLPGSLFLATVATQSLVVNFVTVFPHLIWSWVYPLITLNVIGISLYWIAFALVWVAGGFTRPLKSWIPQNNITHGALSITMLAGQMIEEHLPGTLPYFHYDIQIAWVVTLLLISSAGLYELYLTVTKRKPLLEFQMSNYARNFTYAMFFSCTYYGYTYSNPSIMKSLLHPTMLIAFATFIFAMNAWELGNQMRTYRVPRFVWKGAIA